MIVRCSTSALNAYRITSISPRFLSVFPNKNLLSALSFPARHNFQITKTLKLRTFTTAAATATSGTEAYTFLSEESVSWASLGVSDGLSRALSNAGLHRPSLVQAACIPTILSGVDVIVAAETGSGKTHGYLVPLIDRLCSMTSMRPSDLDDHSQNSTHHVSLVLCPNVMLCEQVVRMANSLCNDSGEPLLKTAAICGRQGLSSREPDIIVSTPIALLNYLCAIDPERRRRTEFIRAVKYVVFDEADLLLCGSFQNQVIRLINMLRFDEKQLSRLENGDDGATRDPVSFSQNASDMEDDEDTEDDAILENDEDSDDGSVVENVESEVRNRKDWRRVRKIYKRSKQYIFVAATLPTNGKSTAGGVLKRIFPDANWISGNYLHRQNPRLKQKWIEVTTDSQVDALISAINSGLNMKGDSSSEIIRTMVFTNTVEAADAVANILSRAEIRCLRYHRDVSLEERTENLYNFQQNGGVFVCTDAAARGLDVSNVSHVIQAEFATSAVDFLHRVGRTARAGQDGIVTSLYKESNRELVAAVRQAEEVGLPLEKAFSRKRSFRNKIKKRGLTSRDDALAVGQ